MRLGREGVRIHSETSQYLLNRVTQVSVGPDGRVVIVDLGEHVIQQFDSAGGYLGSIGREGRGPGEFQGIAVGWLADTLYAIDAALGRVTYFDAGGARLRDSLLQSVTLRDPPLSWPSRFMVIRRSSGLSPTIPFRCRSAWWIPS